MSTPADQMSTAMWSGIRNLAGYTRIICVTVEPTFIEIIGCVNGKRGTIRVPTLAFVPLKDGIDLLDGMFKMSIEAPLCTVLHSCSEAVGKGSYASVFHTYVRKHDTSGEPTGPAIEAATKRYNLSIPDKDTTTLQEDIRQTGSVMPVIIGSMYEHDTIQDIKGNINEVRREQRALMRLNRDGGHPHVIRMFGSDPMNMMIHMERLDIDLGVFFENSTRKQDEVRAIEWSMQLLSALKFIHERGVIHGDLKPPNILLTPDHKNVKICDLSLSKVTATGETTDRAQQTYWWRSPEILARVDGRVFGYPVDVWAMGLVLYELHANMVNMAIPKKQPFSLTPEDTLYVEDDVICDPDAVECVILDRLGCTVKPTHPATLRTVADALDESIQTRDLLENDEHPIATMLNQMVRLDPTHRIKSSNLVKRFAQ